MTSRWVITKVSLDGVLRASDPRSRQEHPEAYHVPTQKAYPMTVLEISVRLCGRAKWKRTKKSRHQVRCEAGSEKIVMHVQKHNAKSGCHGWKKRQSNAPRMHILRSRWDLTSKKGGRQTRAKKHDCAFCDSDASEALILLRLADENHLMERSDLKTAVSSCDPDPHHQSIDVLHVDSSDSFRIRSIRKNRVWSDQRTVTTSPTSPQNTAPSLVCSVVHGSVHLDTPASKVSQRSISSPILRLSFFSEAC